MGGKGGTFMVGHWRHLASLRYRSWLASWWFSGTNSSHFFPGLKTN